MRRYYDCLHNLLLTTGACTIGEQDSFGKAVELPGLNRPFRNGCARWMSVGDCANQKGVQSEFVCPFISRVEGAMFVITDDATLPPEEHQFWSVEGFLYTLPPGNEDAEIDYACGVMSFWPGSEDGSYYPVVLIPTEAGCAQQGGYWSGSYCY